MDDCCEGEARDLLALRGRQASVLRMVLGVSVLAFVAEFGGGLWAQSTSLLGDSLDMLGDSFVYAFSLYVLHRNARWRAGAAFLKGLLMAGFGVGVLVEAAFRMGSAGLPLASAMAGFASLALAVNSFCFLALYRHRSDDVNLRSTWLCTRNDVVANLAVLGAAFAVSVTESRLPDLLVGLSIAALFLQTAFGVLRQSLAEMVRLPQVEVREQVSSR